MPFPHEISDQIGEDAAQRYKADAAAYLGHMTGQPAEHVNWDEAQVVLQKHNELGETEIVSTWLGHTFSDVVQPLTPLTGAELLETDEPHELNEFGHVIPKVPGDDPQKIAANAAPPVNSQLGKPSDGAQKADEPTEVQNPLDTGFRRAGDAPDGL